MYFPRFLHSVNVQQTLKLYLSPAYFVFKVGLTLLVLIFLSACQTVSDDSAQKKSDWLTDSAIFTDAYDARSQLLTWRYSAKVGVKTQGTADQANMIWELDENDFNTVRLYGPLGLGAVKIEFDDSRVVLSDRKGLLHQGDNAQRLLEEVVGLSIPVDALHYWLFSLPLPGKAYDYQLNEGRQLSVLRQLGWEVRYESYREYFRGVMTLARKVRATKKMNNGQDVTVTLITKGWS